MIFYLCKCLHFHILIQACQRKGPFRFLSTHFSTKNYFLLARSYPYGVVVYDAMMHFPIARLSSPCWPVYHGLANAFFSQTSSTSTIVQVKRKHRRRKWDLLFPGTGISSWNVCSVFSHISSHSLERAREVERFDPIHFLWLYL